MKKQYIFLIMIGMTLYILFLIGKFKFNEYKINSHIEYISNLNKEIEKKIINANEVIEYKNSIAFKNKILKEQQGLKNKGEKVIYLTNEDRYNKYTQEIKELYNDVENNNIEKINTEIIEMTKYEKWMFFLFGKNKDL